jgi:TP901 family phage tail tape measure protein
VALRTVGVKLTADISQYTSALARAGAATKDFSGKLDKAAQGGHLDKVADSAGVAGIALGAMAGYAIKAAADFDKAMSGVSAATHASAKDISALRAAALQAGKDTQYSATEAAQGITELSKAGVSTADVLNGGLKGALSLAAAGQMSVAEASETAASALTQFKLKGADVPHVADLLAAAAGKAQGSVHDMGYALNQSGLVAAQFGLSIEDTTGALAEFANAGLIGSDAGTSFKTMLLAMANPSDITKNKMDELNISFYDAKGNFIGLSGVAKVLQDRLGGLSQEARQSALAQIFGNDAVRAASVLYSDGAAGVEKWKSAVNDSGYASKTASDLTNNLSGDIERLKGSIETLAISSGSGANGGLRVLVKSLDAMVGRFLAMPPAVSGTVTVLAGIGAASLLALAAFVKVSRGIAAAVEQLNAMGPAGEKAATGLQKTVSAAGKTALAFAAMEVAAAVLDSFGKKAANVDRLTDSLVNFANTSNVSGEMARTFGTDMKGLNDDAGIATSGVAKWLDQISGGLPFVGDLAHAAVHLGATLAGKDDYQTAVQNFANLDQALAQAMTTTNDATKAQALWNEVVLKSGLDGQQLMDLLPTAYKEVGKLNQAQMDGAKSGKAMADGTQAAAGGADALAGAAGPAATETKKLASASDAAAAAAKGQRVALSSLADFMKQETDPIFGLIKAQQDLVDAQKNYSKAVKEHGKKSDEAKQADRELALAAIALQDAVGKTSDGFNGKLSPALKKTLQAAGLSKAEIKLLEQQFKDAKSAADKYDGKYVAKASAPGAVTAKQQMADAWAQAKGFQGTYTAKALISGDKVVSQKLAALLVQQRVLASGLSIPAAGAAVQKDLDRNRQRGYASGGPVAGWSPHSKADNIPAMLTADEWVHPVDSVRYYGPQVMSAIQHRHVPREVLAGFASGQLGKMGDLPLGLALGGRVQWPFETTAAHTRIPTWAQVLSKIPGGSASSFLHAQDGKPYVWASAGPGGYDCSGIVSAVYNLLHGKSPYHHTFSTAGLPGGWFTKPGIGGPLTAAWSNPGEAPASSTTGHMMGMAGGLTFESTGSRGVHLGASTRRLTDFAHIAHYGEGGHVAMKNGGTIVEPVFGVGASGRTYSFGENYQPERVTPMWQNGGGGGGTTVIELHNHAPIGSPYELQNWLEAGVDNLRRKGKLS